jgi:hypothetical protein
MLIATWISTREVTLRGGPTFKIPFFTRLSGFLNAKFGLHYSGVNCRQARFSLPTRRLLKCVGCC